VAVAVVGGGWWFVVVIVVVVSGEKELPITSSKHQDEQRNRDGNRPD